MTLAVAALRAVLLVGGSGTRLWPLSREQYPKQFLPLLDSRSPLQETWLRVAQIAPQAPIAVANETYRFLAAEQLRQSGFPGDGTLMLEPTGRNTAPAIALAALQAVQHGDDAVLLVLPSDHALGDNEAFAQAVQQALPAARAGKFVTFGVVPDYPETGYGYIRAGQALGGEAPSVLNVEAFVEKPDEQRALSYIQEGSYFWNSGMFLFLASRYLEALAVYRPDILQACRAAMAQTRSDGDFTRIDEAAFKACPAESIDYAIMERTPDAAMVPLQAGWSDIGSWDALRRIGKPDAEGNVLHGDVLAQNCRNVYARADGRLVALLGLDDVVVVDTADALLVAARDKVQDVRKVVDKLRERGRTEAIAPRRGFRPWGHYDSIDDGDRFQVKRITVHPGGRLSLQLHHHRAEHWVVVRGTAKVTRGEETFLLTENQSTYIPLGVMHRLENPGAIPLELIEVQSGPYLGEDDIVRFDDAYGR
ncbi:mannose-1-phosphate guanylyltransferase/mannose-6-phosphate isomerase [Pusillimonas sp. CC-YST705]|uniref:mannose-1-phosphate guanylyltransferase n=1 Tax=Mesopusillimonas faecipullorum TaxID=2755040 RepID=A0ABS8CFE9_9BURK|nr:mannose-1-phosphate guanylyltransferase/mannose-6-phosphate isomerase [Mesopusillimonas faecipullorum]MCB5364562.1 mannose-1-phosphate guanylyltransferase/mannose-6-phosphate isomerase [Mesopusillimonas faecipullorum]